VHYSFNIFPVTIVYCVNSTTFSPLLQMLHSHQRQWRRQ